MPAIALRRNPRDYSRHAATTRANHLTPTHSYSYTLRHAPQPPHTPRPYSPPVVDGEDEGGDKILKIVRAKGVRQ